MRGLRFFGNLAVHRDWIEASGWAIEVLDGLSNRLLVCTFDNQSSDPLKRLEGTIKPMREAMTVVQQGGIECVVLVTDGAGYAGNRKIADSPKSATFLDCHGMGCLTSEVLANIARNAGSRVTIIHGEADTNEQIRQEVLRALD